LLFLEICLLGLGLSMDATAVSISNGMIESRMKIRKRAFIALCFSFFQAFMPILGFYFGRSFIDFLDPIDNFLVFLILSLLGLKMLVESRKEDDKHELLTYPKIVIQGVATSIDALMVGLTFAILHVYIYEASFIIFIITLFMTSLGVIVGCKCAKSLKKNAVLLGGMILIILALKFLLEI